MTGPKFSLCASFGVIALLLSGCLPTSASQSQDIFIQDNDGQRRREASHAELLWAIDMDGCTGHLIAPNYMMTANHCDAMRGHRYTSGSAINRGQSSPDITVVRNVESDYDLDYAILEISWASGVPSDQKYPPLIATTKADVFMSTESAKGDELFTVGFPADKSGIWTATYAEGRAKRTLWDSLEYNIGIINGNSGGGVWRKSDQMLVSLTNGGLKSFGQSGWDNNDKDDATHWNQGAAMWNVYKNSKTLKEIFPNGKNKFSAQSIEQKIYVAIGDADPSVSDRFVLKLSVPSETSQFVLCEGSDPCTSSSRPIGTGSASTLGDRILYKSSAPVTIDTAGVFTAVAKDQSGQNLAVQTFRFERH